MTGAALDRGFDLAGLVDSMAAHRAVLNSVTNMDTGHVWLPLWVQALAQPLLALEWPVWRENPFLAIVSWATVGWTILLLAAVATLIAGAKSARARRLVAATYKVHEPELVALGRAIDRLAQPRNYPAACLVEPFVKRSLLVAMAFPSVIPKRSLSDRQAALLARVIDFAHAPQLHRQNAIETFVANNIGEMGNIPDSMESGRLTAEQRLAVITDEDATLVLASAGSGKTSVVAAKTACLIKNRIRKPQEIILMAFNKKAAVELQERIGTYAGTAVTALTFHALGHRIIREVEGKSPALAAHATDEEKFHAQLRDTLMNRLVKQAGMNDIILQWFCEFYRPEKSKWDFKTHDQYSQWVQTNELRTLNGDCVKSFEEWEIANWLYRNGIAHEYEPAYTHTLPADARGAYHPDFRLTASGIYIEHFGVRKSWQPDGSFHLETAPFIDRVKYLEDMAWKRQVHRDNGTILIETFSYEKTEGRLLTALQEKLAPYVTLQPVPADQMFDTLSDMGQVDAFTKILGMFLRIFKSSGTSMQQCHARSGGSLRHQAFLKIFEPLFAAWQARLADRIDFEDMINRATQHVETGRFRSPWRHLVVDEFQDITRGMVRLLRALKTQHEDGRIFAVGDDWQSIYRFAGSDIRLMHDFGPIFGGRLKSKSGVHSTVDLGRTFRSVDKIALPARRFILQNPLQIRKQVATAASAANPSIQVIYYKSWHDNLIEPVLAELSARADRKTSVLLLGRYKFLAPAHLPSLESGYPDIFLRFMTVHQAKGLEADHVVILRMDAGVHGFPCEIVDDPVLDLVLPEPETFDHAEERRLFYVALTRARKSVTILADFSSPSVFVRELADDPGYATIEAVPCVACGKGLPLTGRFNPDLQFCRCGAGAPWCPECDQGWLVKSQDGDSLVCVRAPDCKGRKKPRPLPQAAGLAPAGTVSGRRWPARRSGRR